MAVLLAVVLLVFISAALVSPVYAPLFLHPVHGDMFPAAAAGKQAFWLGVMLAAGRLGEFVGCPVLGTLADRWGIRRTILLSLGLNAGGYMVVAVSIGQRNLWTMIAGQLLIGFGSVVLVLAQAEAAHRLQGAARTRMFGRIFMCTSLAYVIAPAAGGYLADPSKYSWASYTLPFWVGAVVCGVAALLTAFGFRETTAPSQSADVRQGLSNLPALLRQPILGWLLVINVVLYLGIDFVFQFNPVYFVQRWQMTSSQIGWYMALTSVAMVLAQATLIGPLASRLSPRRATAAAAIGLGVTLGLILCIASTQWLWVLLPMMGGAMAIATTNMSIFIANQASEDEMGTILGVAHALRVLGSAALCFGGGILAGLSPRYPLMTAAAATVLAAGLLIRMRETDSATRNRGRGT